MSVLAQPSSAQIILDGKLLGTGTYRGAQPISDRQVVLEISAPGHVPQRRNVQLREDLKLELTLLPEPGPTNTPDPTASEEEARSADDKAAARPRAAPARQRVGRPLARAARAAVAAPSASPAVQPSAKAAAVNCNPPYRLTSDGVQVFKPECL
jgi:hypothetical protein